MIAAIISVPVFLLLVVVQSAIISATPLLQGCADLIMLTIIAWSLQERVTTYWQWTIIGGFFMGFVSASPLILILVAFLVITLIVRMIRKTLWKVPYLAMWIMTVLGTLIIQSITLMGRLLEGADIPFVRAFNLIVLPSILLNILLAAPVLAIIRDLANWLYPQEIET